MGIGGRTLVALSMHSVGPLPWSPHKMPTTSQPGIEDGVLGDVGQHERHIEGPGAVTVLADRASQVAGGQWQAR
eukprot:3136587-Alexandrium_andersonii.AAC.1